MFSQRIKESAHQPSSARRSTFKRWMLLGFGVASTLTAVACGNGNAAPAVCSTNSDWTQGNQESPLMHPGQACIECHSAGEGPRFTLAGTVMAASHDDTDCNGVQGATVEITGADGSVTKLTTNAAGNFYFEHGTLSTPYTAKIISGSKTRAMSASQTVGDCNTCHTAAGDNGAPGRILMPE
jgi:hypothetical protein